MRRVLVSFLLVLVALARPSLQTPSDASAPAVPGQFILEPAGDLIRTPDGSVAEGSLPLAFVRSPDDTGPDRGGRYLIAVNSGYGIQLRAKSNEGQQLLQVIDLAAQPSPAVVQSVYFPTPQSVNVGVAFGRKADASGAWPLYASGGVQDRVWLFTFTPGASAPLSPANDPATPVKAPFIALSSVAPGPQAKVDRERPGLLYPAGLAVSRSARQLFVVNNLADSLAVVKLDTPRQVRSIPLATPAKGHTFLYPYDVVTVGSDGKEKVFVSLWNQAAIAVVDPRRFTVKRRIPTGTHPTQSACVAPTAAGLLRRMREQRHGVDHRHGGRARNRASAGRPARTGDRSATARRPSPLDASGRTLFVGNALSNSVAVVRLGDAALETRGTQTQTMHLATMTRGGRSRVVGYIPTARYPSALAVVEGHLFVGNGKGEPPARPNAPTPDFPPNDKLRGAYSVSLMRSSIRRLPLPDGAALATMTTSRDARQRLGGCPGHVALPWSLTNHARHLRHQREPDLRSGAR